MIKKIVLGIILILGMVLAGFSLASRLSRVQKENQILITPTPIVQVFEEEIISLPQPKLKGKISLEEAIFKRRSRRDYQDFKSSPNPQTLIRHAHWLSLIKPAA